MLEEFNLLQQHMRTYIKNELSGSQIVKYIDDFVSNDFADRLTDELYRKLMDLQDKVAFYVPTPEERKEHSSYFGDEKLRTLITQFLKETTH